MLPKLSEYQRLMSKLRVELEVFKDRLSAPVQAFVFTLQQALLVIKYCIFSVPMALEEETLEIELVLHQLAFRELTESKPPAARFRLSLCLFATLTVC